MVSGFDTIHGAQDMLRDVQPFEFRACMPLLMTTGREAHSIGELRDHLQHASNASIMHHMHHFFIKSHLLEYSNDFARWVGEKLEEHILAERLSVIDPYLSRGADSIRATLIATLDRHLQEFPEPRRAIPGEEFEFLEAIPITFSIDVFARNLAELAVALKYVDAVSVYYHFYEARLRHGSGDFARWIEEHFGEPELVQHIRSIDPFVHTVEGVRTRILGHLEARLSGTFSGGRS